MHESIHINEKTININHYFNQLKNMLNKIACDCGLLHVFEKDCVL